MPTRRHFLLGAGASLLPAAQPVIDIHQHTNYAGRTEDELLAHQRAMGITTTVLLPAGSRYGLDVKAGGNDSVREFALRHPRGYVYFANELPDLPETPAVIGKYLKLGAIGIGEQKFPVDCDSPSIHALAQLAGEFNVPVLLHFQRGTYNKGFERFYKILERYPSVNFIGHAQTFWGHIDAALDPAVLYPKGKVTPGGLTDRYLSDYPNMFGDLSAGSALNALTRDEDHARAFLARHRDKLLYGSDCDDKLGKGPKCSGAQMLAAVCRLAPDASAVRRILHDNAVRLLRLIH